MNMNRAEIVSRRGIPPKAAWYISLNARFSFVLENDLMNGIYIYMYINSELNCGNVGIHMNPS